MLYNPEKLMSEIASGTVEELYSREKETLYGIYKRLPLAIDYAEGCRIYDKNGTSYLDFLSGIAVNTLGHGYPTVLQAVKEQIDKYMHLSNYFYQEPQIALAEKILTLSGLDKVYFSNSGTESFEGAIKLAAKWGSSQGKTEMYAFTGGFHGRTYGSLSLMDKPLYKDGMGPFLPNKHVLPYNNIDALLESINEKTCAVALEFIQGEGGISTAHEDFVRCLVDLREKYNFLIIADEIQAGIGRSGDFLSYMHYGVTPDIVTLAKGLGGGLPLGAIVFNKRVTDVWIRGNHGSTFGGNPVSCAAGLAVLEQVEKWAQKNAREVGTYLHSQLLELQQQFPNDIMEVRGRGMIQGIVLTYDAQSIVDKFFTNKVICNVTAGNVVRILPPLIVTTKEVDEFINVAKIVFNSNVQ